MKKFIYYILSFAVFCSSCSRQAEQEALYQVSLEPQEDTLYFSDIYSNFRIVPLDGTIISNISELVALEDCFIVRGRTEDNTAVVKFSSNGEYISPIVRIGRGPEEMTDVNAIAFNKHTQTIDVLGIMGTTINKYDLNTCDFRNSFSIRETDIISARDFCPC